MRAMLPRDTQLAQCIFARPAYPGPCPALRKQGDNYHCDIVANPRAYGEGPADKLRDAARSFIGASAGCDVRFNGEPADRAFYRKIEQWDLERAAEIAAARKIWGIK